MLSNIFIILLVFNVNLIKRTHSSNKYSKMIFICTLLFQIATIQRVTSIIYATTLWHTAIDPIPN